MSIIEGGDSFGTNPVPDVFREPPPAKPPENKPARQLAGIIVGLIAILGVAIGVGVAFYGLQNSARTDQEVAEKALKDVSLEKANLETEVVRLNGRYATIEELQRDIATSTARIKKYISDNEASPPPVKADLQKDLNTNPTDWQVQATAELNARRDRLVKFEKEIGTYRPFRPGPGNTPAGDAGLKEGQIK